MRIIDADKLPEHKFTRESAKGSDYMRGWNDAIDAIVDNAPTVDTYTEDDVHCAIKEGHEVGYEMAKAKFERPQDEIIKELWNCRDELCLKCERYKEAYRGACEDCRYNSKNMKRWKESSDEVADDKHL